MEEEPEMVEDKMRKIDIHPRAVVCTECGDVFDGESKPCIHLQILADECRSW